MRETCGGLALLKLPPVPDGLSPAQAEAWCSISSDAIELRTLQSTDLIILENAARAQGLARELEALARDAGLVTEGSRGQTRLNPLLLESRAQRVEASRLISMLGLSPKSRASVDAAGYDPKSSHWDEGG